VSRSAAVAILVGDAKRRWIPPVEPPRVVADGVVALALDAVEHLLDRALDLVARLVLGGRGPLEVLGHHSPPRLAE
jgi:hypothetical protein